MSEKQTNLSSIFHRLNPSNKKHDSVKLLILLMSCLRPHWYSLCQVVTRTKCWSALIRLIDWQVSIHWTVIMNLLLLFSTLSTDLRRVFKSYYDFFDKWKRWKYYDSILKLFWVLLCKIDPFLHNLLQKNSTTLFLLNRIYFLINYSFILEIFWLSSKTSSSSVCCL